MYVMQNLTDQNNVLAATGCFVWPAKYCFGFSLAAEMYLWLLFGSRYVVLTAVWQLKCCFRCSLAADMLAEILF
jgi:hypothetical protein